MYKERKIPKPAGVLMIEHRVIERALDAFAKKAQTEGPPDVDGIKELIDFFKAYSDDTHHGKEEDILFEAADRMNLSPDIKQTLAELREDHVVFRDYRARLAESLRRLRQGNNEAREELARLSHEFAPRLRNHIKKEDQVFFPAVDAEMSDGEREKMLDEFFAFDAERVHDFFGGLVERNET